MKRLIMHTRKWFLRVENVKLRIFQIIKFVWITNNKLFISLIVLRFLYGLYPLLNAWILKGLIDILGKVIVENSDIEFRRKLFFLLFLQIGTAFCFQIVSQLNFFVITELGRQVSLSSQSSIFNKIAKIDDLKYFETPKFYDTMRLASQGIQGRPHQFVASITDFIVNLTTFASLFISIIVINDSIIIPIFISISLLIISIAQTLIRLKINVARAALAQDLSPKERRLGYLSQVLSSLQFVKELKLFNTTNYFINLIEETMRVVHRMQRSQQMNEFRMQGRLNLLSSITTGFVLLISIWILLEKKSTLGEIMFLIFSINTIQTSLTNLIHQVAQINEGTLFFQYFTSFMELPVAEDPSDAKQTVPSLQKGIKIKNLSFRYFDDNPWILEDLNLEIPMGKCVALVGLNGTGKTTLVKLLTKFHKPCKGHISWDNIDILNFDTSELRSHIGVIFQDFVRYDLSVRENIGLGNVTEIQNLDLVRQSAIKANINDVINELPRKYESILSRWLVESGEGADLSGGEWQKIATARMFMRNADFYILDEPTSALDVKAESEVYNHFIKLIKGKTCLLISHRFSTLAMADLIAVLENGKIIEYGTHEELLAYNSTYSKLFGL